MVYVHYVFLPKKNKNKRNLGKKVTNPKRKAQQNKTRNNALQVLSTSRKRKIISFPFSNIM